MLVVLVPAALLDTKSGPKSASNSTASHMEMIASDAHISRTSTREYRRTRSEGANGASGATADISYTSFPHEDAPAAPPAHLCRSGDRWLELRSPSHHGSVVASVKVSVFE